MLYIPSKDLAAVVQAARFFTYVGHCWHRGYVGEQQLMSVLRDADAYTRWKRYVQEKGNR